MKKENGFYFGLNEVKSKNIIMPCDKKHQKNIGVCIIKSVAKLRFRRKIKKENREWR